MAGHQGYHGGGRYGGGRRGMVKVGNGRVKVMEVFVVVVVGGVVGVDGDMTVVSGSICVKAKIYAYEQSFVHIDQFHRACATEKALLEKYESDPKL